MHAGKVRYIGSSTFPASEIVEAQWVAERRGRERFVCEQPPYSILVRGIEADVLPTCERYGMGVIPWSPLAGGWLSGKWRKGAETRRSRSCRRVPDRYDLTPPENQRKLDAADALAQLADEAGISLVHLAVAWVHQPPGGDRRDHRAAHHGAARRASSARSTSTLDARDARPHRRDRPARHQLRLGRRAATRHPESPTPGPGGAPPDPQVTWTQVATLGVPAASTP